MSTNPESRAATANQLLLSPDIQREVAQVRAKAALATILESAPEFRWSYVAPRLAKNAIAATLGFEGLAVQDRSLLGAYAEQIRNTAALWEGLANLREGVTYRSGLLQAIVSYELAGYQANSMCLARNLLDEASSINSHSHSPLAVATALFFQRRFLFMRQLSNLETTPDQDPSWSDSFIKRLADDLAIRGLRRAASYFQGADLSEIDGALSDFRLAQEAYGRIGAVDLYNLSNSLLALVPLMVDRSTWRVLGPRLEGSAVWHRYLQLLARGLGPDLLHTPSISELWASQSTAISSGLLSSAKSHVVRMPTSAGKTRVAEMSLVWSLATNQTGKCVYVAPYRALVGELHHTFVELFSDLGYAVPRVIGAYDSDDFETAILESADLLIVTPEKLDLLVRLRPDVADSIRLVVMDEGHILDDPNRGLKYELLLTRLRRRLPEARFLFLSAVVPDQTLSDLAEWLRSDPSGVISTNWRPSIQRVARFEWHGSQGFMTYASTPGAPAVPGFVPGVVRQNTYEYVDPRTRRRRRVLFPETSHKAQTAAELAMTFAKAGPVLVFCSQTNFVESVGKAIRRRQELVTDSGGALPAIYNTANTRSARIAEDWLGREHLITVLLRNGVAVHYGSIPEAVREAIEDDFRRRRYPILVATNTLAQGVNLPLRTVIFHSVWRTDADGDRQRIPARDYWNIAGRAGRAREETEGTVIHIALTASDRADHDYYIRSRTQVEPITSFLLMILRALVAGRLPDATVADLIDPDLLAIAVEEGWTGEEQNRIVDFLSQSLAGVQARREGLPLELLGSAFAFTTRRIFGRVADARFLPTYATTGLSSLSCETLRIGIEATANEFRSLLTDARLHDRDRFVELLLANSLELAEMQSNFEFAGSQLDLLRDWLSGTPIDELRMNYGSESTSSEDLGRFIEDSFAYRLPWVASAALRIAEAALNVERSQFSVVARYLPSMIRYGVPVPEAAWAMTAGVPLRGAAIAMANAYAESHADSDYSTFMSWLSDLSAEELASYGLPDDTLDEAQSRIFTSSPNPLLQNFDGIQSVLPLDVELRRLTPAAQYVAAHADVGGAVDIARDYDDFRYRNSMVFAIDGIRLGFAPRRVAQLLAPEVDSGTQLTATIVAKTGDPTTGLVVRVAL